MQDNSTIKSEFLDFGFGSEINKGITNAGFKVPSPIGLPSMDKIANQKGTGLLVITPTRELASQVADELYNLGKYAGIRTATVYGGSSYSRQIALIEKGAQVVVATPGRLKDLLMRCLIWAFWKI